MLRKICALLKCKFLPPAAHPDQDTSLGACHRPDDCKAHAPVLEDSLRQARAWHCACHSSQSANFPLLSSNASNKINKSWCWHSRWTCLRLAQRNFTVLQPCSADTGLHDQKGHKALQSRQPANFLHRSLASYETYHPAAPRCQSWTDGCATHVSKGIGRSA